MKGRIPKGGLVALARDFESGEFEEYYNALGRFVSKFSEIETNFLTALWHFARLESPISQAVLSGVKIEGATGYINRIADAKGWTKKRRQRFKDFSDQLGLINKLRNDILHNGANWTGQQLDAYKELWKLEIVAGRNLKPLAVVVHNWSSVRNAFEARNRLVHGKDRYTKNMATPHVNSLLEGVSYVDDYCEVLGYPLFGRMPVRRLTKTPKV